jgi:hypothetical protein
LKVARGLKALRREAARITRSAALARKEVIEIKPVSAYGLLGYSQLAGYILALNYVGCFLPVVGTGWHPGAWSPPSGFYLVPVTNTQYIVVGNVGGVLFYHVPPRRIRPATWERMKVKAGEFGIDLTDLARYASQRTDVVLDSIVVETITAESVAKVGQFASATAALIIGTAILLSATGRFAY